MSITKTQLQQMSVNDIINFVSDTPKKVVNRREQGSIRLIDKRQHKVNSDVYVEEGFYVRHLDSNCRVDKVGKSIHNLMK